jgi:4'-phosphopantetheinyl transferase
VAAERAPFVALRPGDHLTAAERARLEGLRVPKRRADWLLGRAAAKAVVARALREVLPEEWPAVAIEIASEPSGVPYARLAAEAAPIAGYEAGERLPVSLSISHTEGHALCAAVFHAPRGPAPATPGLGADLGAVEPRSPAFVETYFTEREQRWVRGAARPERDLRANVVWCAKEAALKALGLGLTVDTRDVECQPEDGPADAAAWPLAPAAGGWRPFAATCSATNAPAAAPLHGIWRRIEGFVVTLAVRPRA